MTFNILSETFLRFFCFKRRDWDLNPGGAKLHKISSLAPYQARLSRHYEYFIV
jgi:hypothetical protein